MPGASQHTLLYYTLQHALQLNDQLVELQKQSRDTVVNLVVVGSGLVGVELINCVADDLGRKANVTVIESGDGIMDAANDLKNRRTCFDVLWELSRSVPMGA